MADEDDDGHDEREGERHEPDDVEDRDVARADGEEGGDGEPDGAAQDHRQRDPAAGDRGLLQGKPLSGDLLIENN